MGNVEYERKRPVAVEKPQCCVIFILIVRFIPERFSEWERYQST